MVQIYNVPYLLSYHNCPLLYSNKLEPEIKNVLQRLLTNLRSEDSDMKTKEEEKLRRRQP